MNITNHIQQRMSQRGITKAMIDYGSQFEQNLQYKLYKQLDKEK